MTQQLSPAAQEVQFAAFRVYDEEEHLYVVPAEKHAGMVAAAALRAAADQVVPEFWHEDSDIYGETIQDVREKFLAIAAELEAQ